MRSDIPSDVLQNIGICWIQTEVVKTNLPVFQSIGLKCFLWCWKLNHMEKDGHTAMCDDQSSGSWGKQKVFFWFKKKNKMEKSSKNNSDDLMVQWKNHFSNQFSLFVESLGADLKINFYFTQYQYLPKYNIIIIYIFVIEILFKQIKYLTLFSLIP